MNVSRLDSSSDSTFAEVPCFTAKSWSNPQQLAALASRRGPSKAPKAVGDRNTETVDDVLKASVASLSTTEKHELARQLGYESLDDLLAGSRLVTLADGSTWCLTIDRSGTWAAWNICAIVSTQPPMPADDASVSDSGQRQ